MEFDKYDILDSLVTMQIMAEELKKNLSLTIFVLIIRTKLELRIIDLRKIMEK